MEPSQVIDVFRHRRVVFFTGAGMSAESGIPTYRGRGGIWNNYNWEEYACQSAFDRDPERVLSFHELRRQKVLECEPHPGHVHLAYLQQKHPGLLVVTQNTDGMHQRAGCREVVELHGSLWRLRCKRHGLREDMGATYKRRQCERCGEWLRPDITWFEDALDERVFGRASTLVSNCELFVSIGTSAAVWPAAGLPRLALQAGAQCIEINIDETDASAMYQHSFRGPAGTILPDHFPLP